MALSLFLKSPLLFCRNVFLPLRSLAAAGDKPKKPTARDPQPNHTNHNGSSSLWATTHHTYTTTLTDPRHARVQQRMTNTMEVDEPASSPSSGAPRVSFSLLQQVRLSQAQNGLKHGDYARYRSVWVLDHLLIGRRTRLCVSDQKSMRRLLPTLS
jgi:hypothetical protein